MKIEFKRITMTVLSICLSVGLIACGDSSELLSDQNATNPEIHALSQDGGGADCDKWHWNCIGACHAAFPYDILNRITCIGICDVDFGRCKQGDQLFQPSLPATK